MRGVLCRRVLCVWAVLLAAASQAQGQGLPITIYATAEGLPHNTVNRVVRDTRGFLWFCTADGLSRFDGYEFTNFGTHQGLPQAPVNDLLETASGDYWVATEAGLVRFDPKGTPARGVRYESDRSAANPMFEVILPDGPDRRAAAITVLRQSRDGSIWAGTRNGLYRLDFAGGHHVLHPVDVSMPADFPEQRVVADVLDDARGSLWVAAPSGLYRRWPDGTTARYSERDGLPNTYLSDLMVDHSGQLWVATRLAGFFRIVADGTHRAPVVDRHFNVGALPTSWVYQLFETFDLRFWVATARGLVEFVDGADERARFRAYAARNGLTDYEITTINDDRGGNLWLGTASAGAMKLTRGGFNTYGKPDGIETVNAIFEDQTGQLCFRGTVLGDATTSVFEGAHLDLLRGEQAGIHSRLGCFNGRRFDWFWPGTMRRNGGQGWVLENVTLRTRSGEWWVAADDGLYRFAAVRDFTSLRTAAPLAVYRVAQGLPAPQVFRLFEDSHGRVWVSTAAASSYGLARWDPLDGRLHDMSRIPGLPSLKDNVARAFGEDRAGNVWIGFSGGLARFAEDKVSYFTTNEGLPGGSVQNIYLDRAGRLWLASAGSGLVRVDDAGAPRPTFVSYTIARGLSSNDVAVIIEDEAGRLYVGGGRGLDQFDPTSERVKRFTTADGLPPGLFRAAFRDGAGVLWFGMTTGLARLAPLAEPAPAPPPIVISAVRVSGASQLVSALGEHELSLADLAPGQNQLQIDFLAIGFVPGDVLRYQYKLEGADTAWSALGAGRSVTYASLASGRYTFVVRAVNSDGVSSPSPASVAFRVLRPVWMRWWFLTGLAFVVVAAVQAMYRYRVRRLLEIANVRARIATDLHDDIGANLTRIAMLSEATARTGSPGSLGAIAQIARESVSSMNDIVWAINPRRETLRDLISRMRQHANELFTSRGVDMRFRAPSDPSARRLGINVRRDVLLMFKEAANNVARHSNCSSVTIDVQIEDSTLLLVVADNGRGFDPSVESEGQGLASLRRRARSLSGTIQIVSQAGAGTTVTVSVPI